jgi:predicted transcriptional regulator
VEFAIGMGQAELAAEPGEDVPPEVQMMVASADDTIRQRARHWLLGNALAPHAKWRLPTEADIAKAEAEAEQNPVTVADLERQLRELAESGDRGAILALLAALDPARYGPPGKTVPPPDTAVDTVDFAPVIKT